MRQLYDDSMFSEDQQSSAKERRRTRIATCLAGAFVLSVLLLTEFRGALWPDGSLEQQPSADLSDEPIISPVESLFAKHRATEPTYPLPSFIAEQLPSGSYQNVRAQLIRNTVSAVEAGNRLALAQSLALLGAATLAENDLASSRVYLDEALEVYELEDDQIGIGSVELLRSRVESVARENARDAASAHDVIQISAWMIVKQRFYDAEESIQSAIAENLRLDRYGAAAAGYEMLERGYASVGDTFAAAEAAIQAVRLHAASGRVQQAQTIAQRLQANGLGWAETEQLQRDIDRAAADYTRSVHEIRRAQDYEHLYRRLLAAGDPVQAWQFRAKANDSLALASKRAMHRRQTGIVALLYNSNQNRRAASESLERARAIFSNQSRNDVLEHIDRAQYQIW